MTDTAETETTETETETETTETAGTQGAGDAAGAMGDEGDDGNDGGEGGVAIHFDPPVAPGTAMRSFMPLLRRMAPSGSAIANILDAVESGMMAHDLSELGQKYAEQQKAAAEAAAARIVIALTNMPPVSIVAGEWPFIARSERAGLGMIGVREHADGRRIVHGYRAPDAEGVARCNYAGHKVFRSPEARDEATVHAIRGVATEINAADLANDCIALLPPEQL